MCFDDQPEAPLQIIDVAHAHSFPDQTGDTIAPLVVQAFDNAGFSAAFALWPVLPGSEPFGVVF